MIIMNFSDNFSISSSYLPSQSYFLASSSSLLFFLSLFLITPSLPPCHSLLPSHPPPLFSLSLLLSFPILYLSIFLSISLSLPSFLPLTTLAKAYSLSFSLLLSPDVNEGAGVKGVTQTEGASLLPPSPPYGRTPSRGEGGSGGGIERERKREREKKREVYLHRQADRESEAYEHTHTHRQTIELVHTHTFLCHLHMPIMCCTDTLSLRPGG